MIWSRKRLASLFLVGLSVLQVSTALSSGQPASPAGTGSKTWVGRYHEVEEYLRTAECVRMEELTPGLPALKRCILRPGGPVSRMAWHPLLPGAYRGFKESYKADVAAYELDKLLKMDMVPPTVERELEGHKGSATFWVENATVLKSGAPPGEPNRAHYEGQLLRMRMFADLIADKDRNTSNVLQDVAWNLILLDYSRAFGTDTELPFKLTRIDRDVWAKMDSLTRRQLDATLGPWLDDDQISAILIRRDRMTAEVKALPR